MSFEPIKYHVRCDHCGIYILSDDDQMIRAELDCPENFHHMDCTNGWYLELSRSPDCTQSFVLCPRCYAEYLRNLPRC